MIEIKDILDKTEKSLRTSDHMIYITYPLIKENRLLKKIIEDLYEIANNIMNAILQYEHTYKRINLDMNKNQDHEYNFNLFKNKCADRFNITSQEIQELEELFKLMMKHKESSFEFSRKNKLVIMSDNLRTESINLERLKKHLNILKIILKKTKNKIENK